MNKFVFIVSSLLFILFVPYSSMYAQQSLSQSNATPFSKLLEGTYELKDSNKLVFNLKPTPIFVTPYKLNENKNFIYHPIQFEKFNLKSYSTLNHNNINFISPAYSDLSSYKISDESVFYLNNSQNTLHGLSSVNRVTVGVRLQPTENWSIDINSSVLKYRDLIDVYGDLTFGISTYIPITDKMGVNLFGEYSTRAHKNVYANYDMKSPFAAYPYFGGSLQYKFSDNFKIEGGMEYQYNFWTKRWEHEFFISPKILLK